MVRHSLTTPQFSNQRSSLNRKLLIRSCKGLLPSLLSLGSLEISSAAFGNYKPEKEEANYRDWSCTLLIMLLLPLGHANSPLSTGFSNVSSAFRWRPGIHSQLRFTIFVTLLPWSGIEWYFIMGSSKQFHGHTGSFGKASCSVVLWLRAALQASNQIISLPHWYFLIPLLFPHSF